MLVRISGWLLTCALALAIAAPAHAVLVTFEGLTPGTVDPRADGVTFSGGAVGIIGFGPYYKTCCQAYHVATGFNPFPGTGMADIVFDMPADSVSFYFVHGGLFDLPQGTATAFAGTTELGSVPSFLAPLAGLGTDEQVVHFDFAERITSIHIVGGGIDDFEFAAVPEPLTGALLGLGLAGLAFRRRTPSRIG